MFEIVFPERSQDRLVLHANSNGQIYVTMAVFIFMLMFMGLLGIASPAPGAWIGFAGIFAVGVIFVMMEFGSMRLTLDRSLSRGHLVRRDWRGQRESAFDLTTLRCFRYEYTPGHEEGDSFAACPVWNAENLPVFDIRANSEAEGRVLVFTLNLWLSGH